MYFISMFVCQKYLPEKSKQIDNHPNGDENAMSSSNFVRTRNTKTKNELKTK